MLRIIRDVHFHSYRWEFFYDAPIQCCGNTLKIYNANKYDGKQFRNRSIIKTFVTNDEKFGFVFHFNRMSNIFHLSAKDFLLENLY